MAQIEQTAVNSVRKNGPGDQGSTSVRASLERPTVAGRLVVIMAVLSGGVGMDLQLSASGFTALPNVAVRDLQVAAWYREGAPPMTTATVSCDAYRAMQVRILEVSGIAQSAALDRVTSRGSESDRPSTGSTATTTRADEYVLGIIANQYGSTTQSGFSGGLARLYESTSPLSDQQDWESARYSVHQLMTSATGSFSLSAQLSTSRRWVGILATFKGGTTGPLKLSSTTQPAGLVTGGARSRLTVFGRLRSTTQPAGFVTGGARSRIGPFGDQFRLGGWSGLLIGSGTDIRVESVEGLQGWDLRTSDTPLSRGDGDRRGPDLQTGRMILFRINFDGPREDIEAQQAALLRALAPRRDDDTELIFRLPGQPLKSLYYRPGQLALELTTRQTLLRSQAFVLRCADPRHYSALIHRLTVPVSPDRDDPVLATAANLGSTWAYPIIRISGPAAGEATRVVATNLTTGQLFDVAASLSVGSLLVGDMPAQITGTGRSAVTIDGQSARGAWQPPRRPFALAPGLNDLMFEVEPPGVLATCDLEYRSTWSG